MDEQRRTTNGAAVTRRAGRYDQRPGVRMLSVRRVAGRGRGAQRVLWRYGIWSALAVVVAVLFIISPSFRTTANLTNILEQNSMLGIVACGMVVMIISGGFDLSVGAVGATVAVTAAYFSNHSGVPAAIVVGLGVGMVIGLLNGLLIAKGRINPFMTTFAMASIVTGVLFVATSAAPVNANAGWLTTLALLGHVAGIPDAFVLYMIVALITWLLLTRTKWGHYLYSVGGNREASFLSGVPVISTQAAAFVFGSLCAAIGGLLLLGQSDIGQPSSATDWPLTAIAICVIAGVPLSGGEGRVQDTIAAALLLGVVYNGLNLLNVSPYVQPAVTGAVILTAVAADQLSRRGASFRAGNETGEREQGDPQGADDVLVAPRTHPLVPAGQESLTQEAPDASPTIHIQ